MKRSLILVAGLLLSPLSNAEATQGEISAYRAGVVTGAYVSYINSLIDRLAASGVPMRDISRVIERGCRNVTVSDAMQFVLATEPVPKDSYAVVAQTHALLDEACEALVGSSS